MSPIVWKDSVPEPEPSKGWEGEFWKYRWVRVKTGYELRGEYLKGEEEVIAILKRNKSKKYKAIIFSVWNDPKKILLTTDYAFTARKGKKFVGESLNDEFTRLDRLQRSER